MSCAFRFCLDVYFFLLPRAMNLLHVKSLILRTHFRHPLDLRLWMNLPAWKALLAMETLAYEYILTISKHHLEEATRLDAATEDIWEMKLHASNAALISPLSKATSFAGVVMVAAF